MSTNNKHTKEYSIPFKAHSAYKWTLHLVYIFLIGIFVGFVFIPTDEIDIVLIIMRICMGAIGLFFLYMYVYAGILKKLYIELTENDIRIKTLFKFRTIKWIEIYDMQIFTQSNNTMLGLALKEKVKKRKDTFFSAINDMYGGMFSVRIVLNQFYGVDAEKLFAAMVDKLVKVNEHASELGSENISENVEDYSVKAEENTESSSLLKALIKAVLLSIGLGIGYGFTIYLLSANIFIIPIFGSMGIIYDYSKTYKEEKLNIFARIFIGLTCAMQVFIAVITTIIIDKRLPLDIENLLYITKGYFIYLSKHSLDQGLIIVIALFCFGFGAIQGHKFKFQKRLEKLNMKKLGKYYYKKDGRLVNIYLKDPVAFDLQGEKKLLLQLYKGCLIEKEKKKVKAFYIPASETDELDVIIGCDDRVIINEISYYKIDLGSGGNPLPYGFPCRMVTSSKKELELIQIEL